MQALHPEFQRFIDKQPYSVTLDGLELTVEQDVFPPDMGQCAQNMARFAKRYQPQSALDMGCGTGYLALMLKRQGIPQVWASDIHPPAVACASKNVARNAPAGSITVVQSDLFQNIPETVKFDLIIFNQPFGPGRGDRVCGCGADGGYQITKRFLSEAPAHLSEVGAVMMAFSDRELAENCPSLVADELGYPVNTLLHEYYGESNNYIFEIWPGGTPQ